MSQIRILYLAVILAAIPSELTADEHPGTQRFNSEQFFCDRVIEWSQPNDFRLRNSTRKLKGRFEDGKKNHLDRATSRMDDGEYSMYVLGDIHYLLERWPNDYLTLQALIRYESGGGSTNPRIPVICYFESARKFVPDDANVMILQGIYFHNKANVAMAAMSWQGALQIDPSSPEAHYNLGLLYFDKGKYNDALEHAIAAYKAGFPLPGLKNKLVKAGHWNGEMDYHPPAH